VGVFFRESKFSKNRKQTNKKKRRKKRQKTNAWTRVLFDAGVSTVPRNLVVVNEHLQSGKVQLSLWVLSQE
jgi:hypothetical protein